MPVVNFADGNLKACINQSILNRPVGADITLEQAATTNYLHCSGKSISNLRGLEHSKKLGHLNLSKNRISDLTPPRGLKILKRLLCTTMRSLT